MFSLTITELELLVQVIHALLVIYQSSSCDVGSECRKERDFMNRKIKTFDIKEFYKTELEENNEYHESHQIVEIEDHKRSNNEILDYLHEINKKCQQKSSNENNDDGFETRNYLECPGLEENLITLYGQFPAWTNVMRKYYPDAKDVSTSAGSECYFKIMRNEYSFERPISAN